MKKLCREAFNAEEPTVLGGYEFDQGVAFANKKWLETFVVYLFNKCELDYEDVSQATGLSIEEIEKVIDVDNKMGAGIF